MVSTRTTTWTLLQVLLVLALPTTHAFTPHVQSCHKNARLGKRLNESLYAEKSKETTLQDEADSLRSKAAALRQEIKSASTNSQSTTPNTTNTKPPPPARSKWRIPAAKENTDEYEEYRLYCDIGREEGTWMDPRWASSGKRMEFTLDVRFYKSLLANAETQKCMVKDNVAGKSTPTYVVQCADKARLLGGFDAMSCQENGGYRIDVPNNFATSSTLRFFVTTKGKSGSEYGDVSCPPGRIYFSLPCFGSDVSQLSSKEGLMSVRQVGWNTGWRREESRMLGVFRVKKMEDAVRRDGY